MISAVIVAWNSAGEIEGCIRAVMSAGAGEVIVVDNGSSDNTRAIAGAIAGVRLLYFPENLGFSGGVNRGAAVASGDMLLILNPDCRVQSGLESMAQAAAQGAAGGMLLGLDGLLQQGFAVRRLPTPLTLVFEVLGINRMFSRNPVNRSYRCHDFNPHLAQAVEQPPGAFFMVSRSAFLKIGGMDEIFWPVWFEDVDFCKRLMEANFAIQYCPEAQAIHQGGASIQKIIWPFKELAWYGSLLRYATKHFGWLSRRLVGLAVAAASVPRALTGIFSRHKGIEALSVYANVFHLAWVSLVHGRVDHRRLSRRMEGAEHL